MNNENETIETSCDVQVLPKGMSINDPEVWKRGSGKWITVMTNVRTKGYVIPFVKTQRQAGGFDWGTGPDFGPNSFIPGMNEAAMREIVAEYMRRRGFR